MESYTAVLDDEFQVYTATTGEEGLACLQRESIGLVIAAMASPPWHGRSPVTPVETVVPLAFGEVVGQSTPIQQLATLLSRVADTDTVLPPLFPPRARCGPGDQWTPARAPGHAGGQATVRFVQERCRWYSF